MIGENIPVKHKKPNPHNSKINTLESITQYNLEQMFKTTFSLKFFFSSKLYYKNTFINLSL